MAIKDLFRGTMFHSIISRRTAEISPGHTKEGLKAIQDTPQRANEGVTSKVKGWIRGVKLFNGWNVAESMICEFKRDI